MDRHGGGVGLRLNGASKINKDGWVEGERERGVEISAAEEGSFDLFVPSGRVTLFRFTAGRMRKFSSVRIYIYRYI